MLTRFVATTGRSPTIGHDLCGEGVEAINARPQHIGDSRVA